MADQNLHQYREAYETANRCALQLQALLSHTYGESHESFQEMGDAQQDAYLWLCTNLADSVLTALGQMGKLARPLDGQVRLVAAS